MFVWKPIEEAGWQTGNVHTITSEGVHTHTHWHCAQSKQERAACERATSLIQSATGESAKGLLLAHWWDKKLGRRCVFVRFRGSQSQPFFFFFYRMGHPLSIGPHLPCCVIVAHLIQTVQGFFLYLHPTSLVSDGCYAACWAQRHHIFAFEWVLLWNQDEI